MMRKVVVIGAGPAGLAAGACLKKLGIDAVIVERSNRIANTWNSHYKRLHLHTDRRNSGLPGLAMPSNYPRYPSRQQVVDYLQNYASSHELEIRLNTEVEQIVPGPPWTVETNTSDIEAENIVMCTGYATEPRLPEWSGQAGFPGQIEHSNAYFDAAPYRGARVLVVGFGNSGGEIALDLAEAGVDVHLAVRGAVNVIPREILGIPILSITVIEQWIPYRVADKLNAPVIRLLIGNLGKLGLKTSDKGPMAQAIEDSRIPVLDVGTLAAIRSGKIQLQPGLRRFDGELITFTDGTSENYDAVILATGYTQDLRPLMARVKGALDLDGRPKICGQETQPGLYFINYHTVTTGQLRQCGIEARAVAKAIANRT
ncbi:MAG: NAD(P)/FAD-dependent oxidoreductase [Pseudomonadota bacterium]